MVLIHSVASLANICFEFFGFDLIRLKLHMQISLREYRLVPSYAIIFYFYLRYLFLVIIYFSAAWLFICFCRVLNSIMPLKCKYILGVINSLISHKLSHSLFCGGILFATKDAQRRPPGCNRVIELLCFITLNAILKYLYYFSLVLLHIRTTLASLIVTASPQTIPIQLTGVTNVSQM